MIKQSILEAAKNTGARKNDLEIAAVLQGLTPRSIVNNCSILLKVLGEVTSTTRFILCSVFYSLFILQLVVSVSGSANAQSMPTNDDNVDASVSGASELLKTLFVINAKYSIKQHPFGTEVNNMEEYKEDIRTAILEHASDLLGLRSTQNLLDYSSILQKYISHLLTLDYKRLVRALNSISNSQHALSLPLLLHKLVATARTSFNETGKRGLQNFPICNDLSNKNTSESAEAYAYNAILQWAFGIYCCWVEKITTFFTELDIIVSEPDNNDLISNLLSNIVQRFPITRFYAHDYSESSDGSSKKRDLLFHYSQEYDKALDKCIGKIKSGKETGCKSVCITLSQEHALFLRCPASKKEDFVIFVEIMRICGVHEIKLSGVDLAYVCGESLLDDYILCKAGSRLMPLFSFILPTIEMKMLLRSCTPFSGINLSCLDTPKKLHIAVEYGVNTYYNLDAINKLGSAAGSITMVFKVKDFYIKAIKLLPEPLKILKGLQNLGFQLDLRGCDINRNVVCVELCEALLNKYDEQNISWFSLTLDKSEDMYEMEVVSLLLKSLVDRSVSSLDFLKSLEETKINILLKLIEYMKIILERNKLKNLRLTTYKEYFSCTYWRNIPELVLRVEDTQLKPFQHRFFYFADVCLDESTLLLIALLSADVAVLGSMSFSSSFIEAYKKTQCTAFLRKLANVKIRTLRLKRKSPDEFVMFCESYLAPEFTAYE